jgi:hypothetical protein
MPNDDLRSILDIIAVTLPAVGPLSLWTSGDRLAIVGDNLSNPLVQGQILKQWRIGTEMPPLVVSPPDGYVQVPPRTPEEVACLKGDFLHHQDFEVELLMRLSSEFPLLAIDLREKTITVQRPLSETESDQLLQALAACGFDALRLRISPVPLSTVRKEGDVRIIPKQKLSRTLSTEAKNLFEADEDFWVQHRVKVFDNFNLNADGDYALTRTKSDYIPDFFHQKGPRCVVDTLASHNIRTLLPIFRQIILPLPFESQMKEALKQLRITQHELITLAARGRVAFLIPQSPDRYSANFLNQLIDSAPKSALPSRRLAACAIADATARFPLLYAPTDVSLRREILVELAAWTTTVGPEHASRIGLLANFFKEAWPVQARIAQQYGAAFVGGVGPGLFIQTMAKGTKAERFDLEIGMTSPLVEWGGVFDATLFPIDREDYSAVPIAQFCSSIYTGVPLTSNVESWGDFGTVVDSLLGVDNDTSVLEWELVIGEREIQRLHDLVSSMVNRSASFEDLAEIIEDFNRLVRTLERRRDHLRNLSVSGLVTALAGIGSMAAGAPLVNSAVVSLVAWILTQGLHGVETKGRVGTLFDFIRSSALTSSSSAVMVSRIRRGLPRSKPVKSLKSGG